MSTRNPWRSMRRFTLPRELVERLEAEASDQGVEVERLVEGYVLSILPVVLAGASAELIKDAIQKAEEHDLSRMSDDHVSEGPR